MPVSFDTAGSHKGLANSNSSKTSAKGLSRKGLSSKMAANNVADILMASGQYHISINGEMEKNQVRVLAAVSCPRTVPKADPTMPCPSRAPSLVSRRAGGQHPPAPTLPPCTHPAPTQTPVGRRIPTARRW